MRCAKCGHLWRLSPLCKPTEPIALIDKFQLIRPSDTPAGLPAPDMAAWVLDLFLTPIYYAVTNVLIPLVHPAIFFGSARHRDVVDQRPLPGPDDAVNGRELVVRRRYQRHGG